jgi:hypothetical protein
MKQPKGRPFLGISMNIPLWLFFIFLAETGEFKSFIWGLVACLGVTQLGVFLGKWCSAFRLQIFQRILLFSIPAAVILAVILFKVVQMTTPIPADKLQFIGDWKTLSGFELQIGADGTARILNNSSGSPSLNIPVGPPGGTIDGFNVQFAGDSTLEIVKPAYFGKTYKINLWPKLDSSGYLMILNGITLYRQ